jgi:hypothetical protein
VDVLGQVGDVGRLQLVVGPLDELPSQFADLLLELLLEVVGAARAEGLAAELLNQILDLVPGGGGHVVEVRRGRRGGVGAGCCSAGGARRVVSSRARCVE